MHETLMQENAQLGSRVGVGLKDKLTERKIVLRSHMP